MSQFLPKPYERFEGNVKVELDLSNYAAKDNLKVATSADVTKLAAKSDLANLKAKLCKIDPDRITTVPADLSKLSNVLDNDVVKKLCLIN